MHGEPKLHLDCMYEAERTSLQELQQTWLFLWWSAGAFATAHMLPYCDYPASCSVVSIKCKVHVHRHKVGRYPKLHKIPNKIRPDQPSDFKRSTHKSLIGC